MILRLILQWPFFYGTIYILNNEIVMGDEHGHQ